jgi:hypothetical protein
MFFCLCFRNIFLDVIKFDIEDHKISSGNSDFQPYLSKTNGLFRVFHKPLHIFGLYSIERLP